MKNNSENSIQRFFAAQRQIVDSKYHSVEGDYDYDMADGDEDYDSVEGDFQYADDFNAVGPVAKMPARKSQPYIISVQNTTTADITNVTVGPAFTQLFSTDNTGYGNTAGIVITSGIPNTTFRQWLSTNQLIPYTVGETIVTGLGDTDSEANAQAQVVVTLAESLADGNNAGRPLIFQKDPYQNQNNIVRNGTSFKVDSFLTITIARIYGGATMEFKFYPIQNVSQTRSLGNASQVRTYLPPQVVNQQRLVQAPQRLGGYRQPAQGVRRTM